MGLQIVDWNNFKVQINVPKTWIQILYILTDCYDDMTVRISVKSKDLTNPVTFECNGKWDVSAFIS